MKDDSEYDLIDWIDKVIAAYKVLQNLYRDRKDFTEVIATLSAVEDYVRRMKPYDSDDVDVNVDK